MTPVAARHVQSHRLPAQQPPGRVLVVDDYAEVRAIVAKLLTNAGYAVTCAASGEGALHQITAGSAAFDLLLTDLDMSPGMWGDELVRQVLEYTPFLRVIIMAGQPDCLSARARLDWPEVEVLRKPFYPAELFMAVRAALAGDTVLVPAHLGEQRR